MNTMNSSGSDASDGMVWCRCNVDSRGLTSLSVSDSGWIKCAVVVVGRVANDDDGVMYTADNRLRLLLPLLMLAASTSTKPSPSPSLLFGRSSDESDLSRQEMNEMSSDDGNGR